MKEGEKTLLECPKCKVNLTFIMIPKGFKKDGSPTKRKIRSLKCEGCGKVFDAQ